MRISRRLALGVLLAVGVTFLAAGIMLWSAVSTDTHTTEPVYAATCRGPVGFERPPPCPVIGHVSVATGSRTDPVPSIVAFIVGGVAVLGIVAIGPRRGAATAVATGMTP